MRTFGLVDAHAERDGGDHDLQLARQEGGLGPVARLSGHAGVIEGRRELAAEHRRRLLGDLARRRVQDGRPPLRVGEQPPRHRDAIAGRKLEHLDGQVLAAKAVDEGAHLPAQAELLDDVVLDHRRGGGGQGDDRRRLSRPAQLRQALAEQPVVGAEVVAPLRDAVRLVDRDQAGRPSRQQLREPGHAQALRRDEEVVELAVDVQAAHPARLLAAATGVDALRLQAKRAEPGDLVLHEGDERAHDQAGPAARQHRQLVAQRLARPGRHDQQQVLPRGRRPAHLLLVRAKRRVAEHRAQQIPHVALPGSAPCRRGRHARGSRTGWRGGLHAHRGRARA